jgi:hypothetical protein
MERAVLLCILRHCERSEAIQTFFSKEGWIASSLTLLAMTTFGFLK